jgi:hypothetical protein
MHLEANFLEKPGIVIRTAWSTFPTRWLSLVTQLTMVQDVKSRSAVILLVLLKT